MKGGCATRQLVPWRAGSWHPIFRSKPPIGIPTAPTTGWTGDDQTEKSLDGADWADAKVLVRPDKRSFTIFEGTSEIQHLVIARAISGLHLT
jgi:alkylation response protein AidB-like acyl-CoA dehydrogenase